MSHISNRLSDVAYWSRIVLRRALPKRGIYLVVDSNLHKQDRILFDFQKRAGKDAFPFLWRDGE
jgi:hypothetical protein